MEWTSTGSSIGISVWGRGVGVGTGGAGLEDEGLVEIQNLDGKKVYHLTDAGREELARHEEDVERIWRRAHGWKDWGVHLGPETAEIWGSWGRLSKAAFKAAGGGPGDVERIREILDRARRELEEL